MDIMLMQNMFCGCGAYFNIENDLENLLKENADVLKRLKNI